MEKACEVFSYQALKSLCKNQSCLSYFLLLRLDKRHGRAFTQQLKDTEGLRILVNGREYQLLGGMETRLKDKDTVALLPLIEGG